MTLVVLACIALIPFVGAVVLLCPAIVIIAVVGLGCRDLIRIQQED